MKVCELQWHGVLKLFPANLQAFSVNRFVHGRLLQSLRSSRPGRRSQWMVVQTMVSITIGLRIYDSMCNMYHIYVCAWELFATLK